MAFVQKPKVGGAARLDGWLKHAVDNIRSVGGWANAGEAAGDGV